MDKPKIVVELPCGYRCRVPSEGMVIKLSRGTPDLLHKIQSVFDRENLKRIDVMIFCEMLRELGLKIRLEPPSSSFGEYFESLGSRVPRDLALDVLAHDDFVRMAEASGFPYKTMDMDLSGLDAETKAMVEEMMREMT